MANGEKIVDRTMIDIKTNSSKHARVRIVQQKGTPQHDSFQYETKGGMA